MSTNPSPSTLEIGKKLVELVRTGKSHEAFETLYDPHIVSVEAGTAASGPQAETGIAACLAKSKQWMERHEIHAAKALGPFPHGERFAVLLSYDVTQRESGKRFTMDEVAVYSVKNGKIVREEFFYEM